MIKLILAWLFVFQIEAEIYAPLNIYQQVSDIYNPSIDDYYLIQNYLTYGKRSIIKRLDDYYPNARNFKIIGSLPEEQPQDGLIAVNCRDEDRENCVVCYSSFNKNYPRGLKRLIKFVSESDFKGHILYRLGGWPNTQNGALITAHVPYAFKAAILKEAESLGFKRAFWLDTAILPYVSLNTLFEMIADTGYFIMGNSHMIGPYTHPDVAYALNITYDETFHIPSCSAGITGIDFTHPLGKTIIDEWYEKSFHPVAFFSPRSDQNVLSIILYKLNLSNTMIPIERLAHNKEQINSKTLLLINREFVNELSLD